MRQLTSFKISARADDFVLLVEGDDGETVSFAAAPEQVESIIEALDELLGEDDEDDAETYQKPLG